MLIDMKLFDRVILTIYTFCLAIVSLILILFPFNIKMLNMANVNFYLTQIKGNYWYSLIGLAFFLVSIRFLITGFKRKKENYIIRHTNFGELRISSATVEGLANTVTINQQGLKNIKTDVELYDEKVIINIKGQVNPDINIPETVVNIQNKVKDHVEKCTGLEVSEVRVEILNVVTPTKTVK